MSILGNRVVRREDPALLRGAGNYVSDLRDDRLEGLCHAVYVRSTSAHARVLGIDASEALDAAGVVAVFTASDLDLAAPRPTMPWVPEAMARPWLAIDRVRFVGEPVAMVLADSEVAAMDAAELVEVDLDPLPALVDPMAALAGEVLVHDHHDNVCANFADDPVDDLFAGCDVVVAGHMVNQRVAPAPLEGRASIAVWSPGPGSDAVGPGAGGHLTHWISTQHPHGAAGRIRQALGLEADQIRVVVPDVGGGFGAKIPAYPEDVLVAWAARRTGRPVRWVETRSESMLGLGHGRDQVHDFEIGATRDGRVLAFRNRIVANAGAYPAMAAFLPVFTRQMAVGTYDIPRVETSAVAVVTNTTPVEAFRGAGRPEATATIERAMDMVAAELGLDPVDVRRRNLIGSDRFPVTTAAGATYDSGDYEGALDAVLDAAGYVDLRAEQRRRRAAGEGPLLGIGVSTYVEITAGGGPPSEYGAVRIEADGTATVRTGSSSHGQGHDTVWASLVADQLGIDPSGVTVIHGDTAEVPRGNGTMGSRSLQLGGTAVHNAAVELLEVARGLASELFEAALDDVVLDRANGAFHVIGSPAKSLSWAELAATHAADLSVEHDFMAAGPTYPFGAHVAVVEVDPDTGHVAVVRMVCCDDAGVIVNPLLAEGQRHGGIAQGVAQALLEEMRYDDDGNPLTGNFADYGIVSAVELPRFELVDHATPTPNNPLGAKGIGESGTIGSTPAVQSAVVDALSHLGIGHLDMPFTAERVWRAIIAAPAGS